MGPALLGGGSVSGAGWSELAGAEVPSAVAAGGGVAVRADFVGRGLCRVRSGLGVGVRTGRGCSRLSAGGMERSGAFFVGYAVGFVVEVAVLGGAGGCVVICSVIAGG